MGSSNTHIEFSNVAYRIYDHLDGILVRRTARIHGERRSISAAYYVCTDMKKWGKSKGVSLISALFAFINHRQFRVSERSRLGFGRNAGSSPHCSYSFGT